MVKVTLPLIVSLLLAGAVKASSGTDSGFKLPDSLQNSPDSVKIDYFITTGQSVADTNNWIAYSIYQDGLSLAIELKDDLRTANLYTILGTMETRWGDFSTAFTHLKLAYGIYEKLQMEKFRGRTLFKIGNLFWFQKDYELAISYYERAKEPLRNVGDQQVYNYCLGNIGLCYTALGKLDAALQIHKEKLENSIALKDSAGMVIDYFNIGSAYFEMKKYSTALEWYKMADKFPGPHLTYDARAKLYSDTAELFLVTGSFSNAHLYVNKSLEISRRYKSTVIEEGTWFLKARIDSASGDYKKAFSSIQRGRFISDSIRAADQKKETLQLERRFSHLLNQKETELLKRENEIQKELINKSENLKVLGILLIVILSILFIVVLYFYRVKHRVNLQLMVRNNEKDQLNKELKELNLTKNKLFTIIAHDIRNPLTPAMGYSEILFRRYDQLDDETRKKHVHRIYNSISDLHRLLENLLNWSNSQTGNIKFEPEYLNLAEIVDLVIRLYQPAIHAKSITVSHQISPDIQVFADPDMLSLIIRNLVNNAIKFTPKNGQVTISGHMENGVSTVVEVSDTGIGINPEKASTLFSMNGKVSETGTSGESGTGLGLILCREFVEKHGGILNFTSEVGKGTTFWFSFPLPNNSDTGIQSI